MSFPSRFMLILLLCLFASAPSVLLAQQAPFLVGESAALVQRPFSDIAQPFPSMMPEGTDTERKSSFLGVLYSIALPGMGELYAGRFDRGKYPFITEIALWIGALGVDMYGDWIQDDARIFAQRHAGFDPAGKDDEFYVSIENYRDLYDYNNQRLIERRTDELYPDEAAWRWSWDSEENRKDYKDQRIHSDEMHNAVTFFVLGMVANRIWSAIQAASSVKQYNASLGERLTSLPSMEPRLRTMAGKVDGIEFQFSW